MIHADFFLASSEGYGLETPRGCKRIGRLRSDSRDDLLLVEVNPPIIGQPYGLGGRDINEVIIATRHQGVSLFPIDAWPVFVHVARSLIDDPRDCERLRDADIESIGWAEIYPTESAAKAARM